jgi:hypothetical protein
VHISLSPIPYLRGMITCKYMYARSEKLKEALHVLKLMLSLSEPGTCTLGVVYSVGIKIMWIGQ